MQGNICTLEYQIIAIKIYCHGTKIFGRGGEERTSFTTRLRSLRSLSDGIGRLFSNSEYWCTRNTDREKKRKNPNRCCLSLTFFVVMHLSVGKDPWIGPPTLFAVKVVGGGWGVSVGAQWSELAFFFSIVLFLVLSTVDINLLRNYLRRNVWTLIFG